MSITRWCHVTWCFTVLTVKYVSDWRNYHFFDSPAVLAKLLQWMWAWRHNLLIEWGKYLSCSVVMAFIVICHHVSKYTKPWGHWKLWQWLSVLISLTHFEVLQLLHSQKITPAWSPFLADLKLTLRASPRGRTSPTWWSTPHHRRRWTRFESTPTPPGLTSLLPGFSWNNAINKMKSWQLQTWGKRRPLYFEAL